VTALGRGTLSGAQAGDHSVLVVVEFTVANAEASFSIGGSIGATVGAQSRFGLPETLDIVVTIEREGGGVVMPAHTFVRLQQGATPETLALEKQGILQPGNYALVALIEANDLNSVGEFNVTLELGP
jgi:hypothetical protein